MSTIKVDTIQSTSGVEVYTAKAWVNFNGTGTVAIRADGNVTSITDNGTGNYTVNFTAAMPDANYSAPAGVSISGVVNYAYAVDVFSLSTASCQLGTGYFNGSSNIASDVAAVHLAIFR